MKCAACGYSDVKADDYREGFMVAPGNIPPNGSKPFIDIRGVEVPPFKQIVESVWPDGTVGPHRPNSHLSACVRYEGVASSLYACPVCGTIKMEV